MAHKQFAQRRHFSVEDSNERIRTVGTGRVAHQPRWFVDNNVLRGGMDDHRQTIRHWRFVAMTGVQQDITVFDDVGRQDGTVVDANQTHFEGFGVVGSWRGTGKFRDEHG